MKNKVLKTFKVTIPGRCMFDGEPVVVLIKAGSAGGARVRLRNWLFKIGESEDKGLIEDAAAYANVEVQGE